MGSDAVALNFLKKLESTDKLIFHVSNLNTRVLDPHHPLASIWHKLWEDSMWVTPKTNRPSFSLMLKLCHVLDGQFSVLSSCIVVNINALFAEWRITTFRYCCIGFFLSWNSLFLFRYKCCDGHLLCFGKYIFPKLQTSYLPSLSISRFSVFSPG